MKKLYEYKYKKGIKQNQRQSCSIISSNIIDILKELIWLEIQNYSTVETMKWVFESIWSAKLPITMKMK